MEYQVRTFTVPDRPGLRAGAKVQRVRCPICKNWASFRRDLGGLGIIGSHSLHGESCAGGFMHFVPRETVEGK